MPIGTYVVSSNEVFVETYTITKFYAELDGNNVVLAVRAVSPENCLDENGVHDEAVGAQFLRNLLKIENNLIETWYYKQNRGRLAMVGGTYNQDLDIFINVQPGPAMVLDENNEWVPPTQPPQDGNTWEYQIAENVWYQLSGEPMYTPNENNVIYDDDGNLLEVDPE